MHGAMMSATEWDREFIADLAAEGTGLREPEVVGVSRLAAAHEARLLGDIPHVLPVAIATWSGDREDALVDALYFTGLSSFGGGNHLGAGNLRHRRIIVRGCSRLG